MTRVVGVDGAKGGWFYVALEASEAEYAVVRTISEVVARNQSADLILVDIPIGLRDVGAKRSCDILARKVLEQRRSSVYPVPCRDAVRAESYAEASAINHSRTGRKLSTQTWAIVPKIR